MLAVSLGHVEVPSFRGVIENACYSLKRVTAPAVTSRLKKVEFTAIPADPLRIASPLPELM